jgi:hypothetical protein
MIHAVYKITSFTIIGPYRLRIFFNDGTDTVIDFKPVLAGPIYGKLRDLDFSTA